MEIQDWQSVDPVAVAIGAGFDRAVQDYSRRDEAYRNASSHYETAKEAMKNHILEQLTQAKLEKQREDAAYARTELQANATTSRTETTTNEARDRVLITAGQAYWDPAQGKLVYRDPKETAAWLKTKTKATTRERIPGPPKPKGYSDQDIALLAKFDAGSAESDDNKITRLMRMKPGLTVQGAQDALSYARGVAPYVVKEPSEQQQPAQFQYEYSRQATEAASRFAKNPGKYKNSYEKALREVNSEMKNVMYSDLAAWVKNRRKRTTQ